MEAQKRNTDPSSPARKLNPEGLSRGEMVMHKKTEAKKMSKSELTAKMERMRAYDAELIPVIFRNLETPRTATNAGAIRFGIKLYPGDAFKFYDLQDGERYVLPRGVVRHLRNNCFVREYIPMSNEHVFGKSELAVHAGYNDGSLTGPKFQASRKKHRFAVDSLEYMDEDVDVLSPSLIEVTMTP